LRQINHPICAARILGAYLPYCLGKTAQDLGALALLSDLSLIFFPTTGGNPASLSSETTRQINLRSSMAFSRAPHYMSELA